MDDRELADRLLFTLNRIACALEQIADNTAEEEVTLTEAIMNLGEENDPERNAGES